MHEGKSIRTVIHFRFLIVEVYRMEILKSNKCFEGQVKVFEHESRVTKTNMTFSVFIPDQNKDPVGCMIWLSGLTCNEDNFMMKAQAQKYFSEKNIMVICPDTSPRNLDLPDEHKSWDFGSGAGFYLTATTDGYKDHYNMFDYINTEIYNIIINDFKISEKEISICGHSMGGHGALIIGLRNPLKYNRISAFSPIVNPTQCPWGQKAFRGYLGGDKKTYQSWDATELINSGHLHPNEIIIEQGLADEFLEKELLTENFVKACENKKQKLQVNYREGYDHSYYFISSFIKNHI